MSVENIKDLTDDELVRSGHQPVSGTPVYDGRPDPRYRIEMMRRLMVSINRLNKSTSIFSAIIGVLTFLMLLLTIGMWVKM